MMSASKSGSLVPSLRIFHRLHPKPGFRPSKPSIQRRRWVIPTVITALLALSTLLIASQASGRERSAKPASPQLQGTVGWGAQPSVGSEQAQAGEAGTASQESGKCNHVSVDAGRRAIVINTSSAKFVSPGDFVDISATLPPELAPQATQSIRLVRRAKVLAICSDATTSGKPAVALALTPEDTAKVDYAKSYSDLSISIAPRNDDNQGSTASLPLLPATTADFHADG